MGNRVDIYVKLFRTDLISTGTNIKKDNNRQLYNLMGNICGKKKIHECAICHTEDCRERSGVCGQCGFIHQFIVDHGRNTLRQITSNHDQQSRPRALSLPPPPPRPPRVTEVRQVWGDPSAQQLPDIHQRQISMCAGPSAPLPPPDYKPHGGF